jgi:hypothetical protein
MNQMKTNWKEIGYWSLYSIPGSPPGLLIYELMKPKEKRNKVKLATSRLATVYLIIKVGLGLGVYHALPEKYQIFNKEEKTIEKIISETERFPVEKTYFFSNLEDNRKVYKE